MSGNINLDAGYAGTQRSIETLDNLIRLFMFTFTIDRVTCITDSHSYY